MVMHGVLGDDRRTCRWADVVVLNVVGGVVAFGGGPSPVALGFVLSLDVDVAIGLGWAGSRFGK